MAGAQTEVPDLGAAGHVAGAAADDVCRRALDVLPLVLRRLP